MVIASSEIELEIVNDLFLAVLFCIHLDDYIPNLNSHVDEPVESL